MRAPNAEVAVVRRNNAAQTSIAKVVRMGAVRDSVVSRRTVNTMRDHEMMHRSRTWARFIVVPRTRQPAVTFFCQLECILNRYGLRYYSGFDRPISRVGYGWVWFEDTSFVIDEVRLKAGTGFGFDKSVTHWSHSKSPHHFVVLQPTLALQQVDLFFLKPS